ncbi:MAG TPA: hypothetical protein VFZ52_07575 [Chryseolinea sp.]
MEIAPRIVATFFITVLLLCGACEIREKEDAKALQEWRDGKAAQIRTLYAAQANAPTVGAMYPVRYK